MIKDYCLDIIRTLSYSHHLTREQLKTITKLTSEELDKIINEDPTATLTLDHLEGLNNTFGLSAIFTSHGLKGSFIANDTAVTYSGHSERLGFPLRNPDPKGVAYCSIMEVEECNSISTSVNQNLRALFLHDQFTSSLHSLREIIMPAEEVEVCNEV